MFCYAYYTFFLWKWHPWAIENSHLLLLKEDWEDCYAEDGIMFCLKLMKMIE